MPSVLHCCTRFSETLRGWASFLPSYKLSPSTWLFRSASCSPRIVLPWQVDGQAFIRSRVGLSICEPSDYPGGSWGGAMNDHVLAVNTSLSSHPYVICGCCCSAKDPQERPDSGRSQSPGPGWHRRVAAVTPVGTLRSVPKSANSCWTESLQLGVKRLDTNIRRF